MQAALKARGLPFALYGFCRAKSEVERDPVERGQRVRVRAQTRPTSRSRRSSRTSGLQPGTISEITGARCARLFFGDSVTTDHISPAGAIKKSSPAGKFLLDNGVTFEDFNSYGSSPRQMTAS